MVDCERLTTEVIVRGQTVVVDVEGLARRFWAKVNKAGPVPAHAPHLGPCWVWTAACSDGGYGLLSLGGRQGPIKRASAVALFLETGAWPSWPTLACHRCDNPPCVRHSHLFLGSHTDNQRDSIAKGRAAMGERHGLAKLTTEDVSTIFLRSAEGMSHRAIARALGVSHGTVGTVLRRTSWKGVDHAS